ncbi:MAG: succinate dehydrogenase cytochrome b subunit [Bacteroidales bacterium]|jgi:succinate dehydrogenase / fumarate reductase cytochrome b subunit|nr:succinate dehydrogenase cytochrome b subunit [Bacteroidales bacterium]
MSNIFTSSIGKKFWMALVGLFLCVFLVLHMSINLLMLLEDRSYFDMGVYIMSTPVVKALEIFLFGSIALHMALGVYLQIRNWLARPVRYAKKHRSENSFFSKYMIWTGGIVLIFFCLHFMDFFFYKYGWFGFTPESIGVGDVEATGTSTHHNFYDIARHVFACKTYCLVYIGFMALLSFHLIHAFQSAFQSIGWNHPAYTPIIKAAGYIYAVAIPAGFALIPLYFFFGGE